MRKVLLVSLAFFCLDASAEDAQFMIRVDGVTCPFCVATSERTLAKIKGVHSVNSDLNSGIIYVCADETTDLSATRLTELFSKRGFTYRSVRKSTGCDNKSSRRQPSRRIARKHERDNETGT
ncbi:MAG: heavy metal-associated domain-containing protein [Woeseia sp.]